MERQAVLTQSQPEEFFKFASPVNRYGEKSPEKYTTFAPFRISILNFRYYSNPEHKYQKTDISAMEDHKLGQRGETDATRKDLARALQEMEVQKVCEMHLSFHSLNI